MTTNPGDFVITMIDGSTRMFIGEVLTSDPLTIKVQETGVLARVKDYLIWEKETEKFQSSEEGAYELMKMYADNGHPLISGLKKLGVEDNELHDILPPDTN